MQQIALCITHRAIFHCIKRQAKLFIGPGHFGISQFFDRYLIALEFLIDMAIQGDPALCRFQREHLLLVKG